MSPLQILVPVLASQSKARAAMLAAAGLAVDLAPADLDERAIDDALSAQGASAAEIALALAKAKAEAVSASQPGRLIIGADQTLSCENRRFSKVKSLEAARAQLQALSGKTHQLHSACAVVKDGAVLFSAVAEARMTMHALSPAFLEAYLATTGEAILGSVGCYHYEGPGIQLFARIEGDYHTILGMPLLPLIGCLRREGALVS